MRRQLIEAQTSSEPPPGVTNLCETEEERGRPCPTVHERVQAELAAAKARGEKVLFIYGSERCGPCLAWKRELASKNIPGIRLVYLPLSYGRPSKDDPAVIKACQQSIQTYQVGAGALPRSIAAHPACIRKPTLFMIDPSGVKGTEVDPGAVKVKSPPLADRLRRIAAGL